MLATQSHDARCKLARMRWAGCFLLAAGLHVAFAAAVLYRSPANAPPADAAAAILVDIAPALTAPAAPKSELPPGPEQTETPPADARDAAEKTPATPTEDAPLKPVVKTVGDVPQPAPKQEPAQAEQSQQPTTPVERTTAPPAVAAEPNEVAAAPARGAPSLTASDASISWQSVLLGHLEQHKRYPSRAKRRRQEGVVSVRLILNRDGDVLERRIAVSSGFSALDTEALALIDRAEPLPPPPPEIKGDVIELVAPIEFFIR